MNGSSFAEGYAIGRDQNGGNGNGGLWGNDGIWAILLLALLGFGGRGGYGFGGGYSGGGSEFVGYELGKVATQADIASGFNNSAVLSSLNDLKLGQAQGFASVQQTLCQGFNGINTGILQNANATERGFATTNFNLANGLTGIAQQISSCCCDLKSMNLENRYLNEKQTCEIIGAINAVNQRWNDIYNADKINALTAENTALKGQISNDKQTANIVSQLRDPGCPIASYYVPNPNCCYNPFGFGFNYGQQANNCSGCVNGF